MYLYYGGCQFYFPIVFPIDMQKLFHDKANKTKQRLVWIFQDNEKVMFS